MSWLCFFADKMSDGFFLFHGNFLESYISYIISISLYSIHNKRGNAVIYDKTTLKNFIGIWPTLDSDLRVSVVILIIDYELQCLELNAKETLIVKELHVNCYN